MMKRVLILDGGAAHAVAIAECLKTSGYYVAIICESKSEYGYHTKFADERYLGMDSHTQGYPSFMLDFLRKHHYDVLIPTSDSSAEFMSSHKSELLKITGVLMPDKDTFDRGYDKNKLMSICQNNGYPCPLTIDLSQRNSFEDDIKAFPYPGLIKPNMTSGGRGMTLVNSYEELIQKYPTLRTQYGECHLQKYIRQGGRQIKVQVLTDENSDVLYSSVIWKQRYYPVNGGSSCCNITIDNPELVEICSRVLKSIGWIGFADFDLIEDPDTGRFLIMEINPRLPACIRSVFKSGIDYATMIADMTLGEKLRNYHYSPGKQLRHLGFDILWFIKSKDRFRAKPSWFHFLSKDLYYQDLVKGDFCAFICGTWGNLKKQMNPEFRKAKSGVKI